MTHSPSTSFDWELRAVVACEKAADCLGRREPERAAEWSRLALACGEAARLKRWVESKHSPEGQSSNRA
jgi:hypothetical protein